MLLIVWTFFKQTSAFEVTTLWRYTNLFIIILIIIEIYLNYTINA